MQIKYLRTEIINASVEFREMLILLFVLIRIHFLELDSYLIIRIQLILDIDTVLCYCQLCNSTLYIGVFF